MQRPSAIARCFVALALPAGSLQGQRAAAAGAPGDSARPVPAQERKSPAAAAVIGLVLPGAGHWYAGERGRGALVAAAYGAGVALVAGGRTDRVGHVGGVLALGALGVNVVDGARAAKRFNARRAPASPPAPNESLQLTERPGGRTQSTAP
jgi:hypothetical protein